MCVCACVRVRMKGPPKPIVRDGWRYLQVSVGMATKSDRSHPLKCFCAMFRARRGRGTEHSSLKIKDCVGRGGLLATRNTVYTICGWWVSEWISVNKA